MQLPVRVHGPVIIFSQNLGPTGPELNGISQTFEIIFSKGNSYSLANVAKNDLLMLLPVLHISVFIL